MDSPDSTLCTVFLFTTFFLAGLIQTLWLRSPRSQKFAHAIDGGMTFRNQRLFGDNKMWRGFVVMIPAAGWSFVLVHFIVRQCGGQLWPLTTGQYFLLGCWTGFGFMFAELPNSFIKRQCGIAAGSAAQRPLARHICLVVDQIDSTVGGLIAISLLVPVPLVCCVTLVLVGGATHLAFNYVLQRLGLRERAA